MKELKIKGTQNFLGFNIPLIEGGFGGNQKVILAKTVAEIHELTVTDINKLINNNIDEFEFGVDIIDLKTGDYKEPVLENELLTKAQWGNAKNIYLLSEQGYFALVQLMRTDKAKEIRKQLRREYFTMREVINSNEQLKAQLLLKIYKGGQEAILSTRQLVDIEVKESTKPLLDKIEENKPKVNYYEDVLNTEGTMTTTQVAKGFNMTAQKLNNYLHDKKVQFKRSGMWMLYKEYDGQGYTDVKTSVIKSGLNNITTHYLVWTEKGRRFIYDLLLGDKLI